MYLHRYHFNKYVHGFTYSLYIVSDSVQCTEDTFCVLVHKFWTSRKRGTGEVGGVTQSAWLLLSLAVEWQWLIVGGSMSQSHDCAL